MVCSATQFDNSIDISKLAIAVAFYHFSLCLGRWIKPTAFYSLEFVGQVLVFFNTEEFLHD
ncbi:hypothetical protein D082_19750 [Synechocystis sp. PCC 6714]|nr:hypothetical protein D082_19750 [Synechocystis sp. PCC 6714]